MLFSKIAMIFEDNKLLEARDMFLAARKHIMLRSINT